MEATTARTGLFLAMLSSIFLAIACGACAESKTVADAGEDASNIVPAYIGGTCETPADCPTNELFEAAFTACLAGPGGYCAVLGCLNPGFTCPGASSCVPSGGGWPGFCVNPCIDQFDCRPGFECFESVTGFHFCRSIPDDAGTGGSAGG